MLFVILCVLLLLTLVFPLLGCQKGISLYLPEFVPYLFQCLSDNRVSLDHHITTGTSSITPSLHSLSSQYWHHHHHHHQHHHLQHHHHHHHHHLQHHHHHQHSTSIITITIITTSSSTTIITTSSITTITSTVPASSHHISPCLCVGSG